MNIKVSLLFFLVFLGMFLTSCDVRTERKNPSKSLQQKSNIKYAKGFEIQSFKTHKKLIIKTPYPDAKETFEFILTDALNSHSDQRQISTPIQNIVVTSTTHIPMLELLDVQDRLVGFQGTDYISSEKTRARIDEGHVKELGKEFAINTEVLFELKPDVVIGFAMTKTNKTYNLIEQNGIPVIINGDWLEETPLGRAEWIKFFGVLFNKEKEADSIFNTIEASYLKAKKIASASKKQPTVLSGAIMRNDVWSLPAGESFVAQFLEDANLKYLWKDTEGKGSLNLSFESVLNRAQQADVWIAPGYFASKEQMLEGNAHYRDFQAFQNDEIYTPSTKTGATGGVIYYEFAPTRPDWVLKDLIKITHPELLPDYKLVFFEKMK